MASRRGRKRTNSKTKYSDLAETEEYEVESIEGKRIENNQVLYLIKWKDYGHEVNTWEPIAHLSNCLGDIAEYEARMVTAASVNINAIEEEPSQNAASTDTGIGNTGATADNANDTENATSTAVDTACPTRDIPAVDVDADTTGQVVPMDENETVHENETIDDFDTEARDTTHDVIPEGANVFDVDILDELPEGKVPVEMLSVIPVVGMIVYCIKWEPEGVTEEVAEEEEDLCLIKADVFRVAYPQIVIDYYQKNCSFLRREVSQPPAAVQVADSDSEHESSMSSSPTSSVETDSDSTGSDTDHNHVAYLNFLSLLEVPPNPSDDEGFRANNNELGEE